MTVVGGALLEALLDRPMLDVDDDVIEGLPEVELDTALFTEGLDSFGTSDVDFSILNQNTNIFSK